MSRILSATALVLVSLPAFALTEVKLKCTADSPGSVLKSVQLEREYDEAAKKVTWFVSYTDPMNRPGRNQALMTSTPVSAKYLLPTASPNEKLELVVGYGSEPHVAILIWGRDADGKPDAAVDFLKKCEHHVLRALPRP